MPYHLCLSGIFSDTYFTISISFNTHRIETWYSLIPISLGKKLRFGEVVILKWWNELNLQDLKSLDVRIFSTENLIDFLSIMYLQFRLRTQSSSRPYQIKVMEDASLFYTQIFSSWNFYISIILGRNEDKMELSETNYY